MDDRGDEPFDDADEPDDDADDQASRDRDNRAVLLLVGGLLLFALLGILFLALAMYVDWI